MILPKLLTATAVSTLLVAASPQDPWRQQVDIQLQNSADALAQYDVYQVGRTRYGSLNEGYQSRFTVELIPYETYIIVGHCDSDCPDLDLEIRRAANEAFIKEDVAIDRNPIIVVTPERTRSFQVRVIMAACDDEPCRWGAAIFRAR